MPLFKKGESFYLRVPSNVDEPINLQLLEDWNLNPQRADKDAIEKLFAAISENDLNKVQQAIAANIPLDVVDGDNYTPLAAAAFAGHEEIVTLLLNHGLNPAYTPAINPKKEAAYNAFHAACAGGQGDIADLLLKNYPQLNLGNSAEPFFLQSGLQIAILHKQFLLASVLIHNNLSTMEPDKRMRTPLATALGAIARGGFFETIYNTPKMQQLENLWLQLLASENAFLPNENSRAAISVVLNFELAMNGKSGKKYSEPLSPINLIVSLMVASPKTAVTLYNQALEANSQVPEENDSALKANIQKAKDFLQLFGEATLTRLTKPNQNNLRVLMSKG